MNTQSEQIESRIMKRLATLAFRGMAGTLTPDETQELLALENTAEAMKRIAKREEEITDEAIEEELSTMVVDNSEKPPRKARKKSGRPWRRKR